MRELIEDPSRPGYRLLPTLAGLITMPPAALSVAAVVDGHDAIIWTSATVLSVIGFWMYVYVYGYVYRLIGKWFGAGGTNAAGRLALAWTQVPYILLWAIVVPLQIVYRHEFFPEIDLMAVMGGSMDELRRVLEMEKSFGYQITNWISYGGIAIAYLWSLFVLGEALECRAWKAFLVKMMAVLLHIPIFIIAAIPAVIIAAAIVMLFPPA